MAALGPLAQEVLEVLVAAGTPLSVREVLDRVNRSRPVPLAYTTVMTVLARLVSRGTAIRERAGRGFRYSAETADPSAEASTLQPSGSGGRVRWATPPRRPVVAVRGRGERA